MNANSFNFSAAFADDAFAGSDAYCSYDEGTGACSENNEGTGIG